jgi:hypothetical protein
VQLITAGLFTKVHEVAARIPARMIFRESGGRMEGLVNVTDQVLEPDHIVGFDVMDSVPLIACINNSISVCALGTFGG